MAKEKELVLCNTEGSKHWTENSIVFIFFGIFSLLVRMPLGLWLILIGWYLYTAAQASYQQSTIQENLSGIKVKDIIDKRYSNN